MEKSKQESNEKKDSSKSTASAEKEYKLIINQNSNNNNKLYNSNTQNSSNSFGKELPLQTTPAERLKDKVNLKFRKFTTNKNHPWKIKEISLDQLPSYDSTLNVLKASLDPSIANSENLKIIFHVNRKDKVYATINSKEDWAENFNSSNKDEFLKAIISEHKTIKIEFELHDLNKNFNEFANKFDLQNKIIENLFEVLKINENVKREITQNLRSKLANENAESMIHKEIFKDKYAKIMQDYTEKVYDTLLNNINNFKSLQDDLKKINLDQELDFNKIEDFMENEMNNFNEPHNGQGDEFGCFGNQGISYRSSFNLDNQEEMISKLIIETRNSMYNNK